MNFSTKKRPRKDAWRDLQRELDERERLEEDNSTKFARLDALKSRTALEDDVDPQKTHAYMDIMIGRDIGKDPKLTRGRLIFELFEDLMPRTVEQFIRMLESKSEPTYSGSAISKVFPGYMCEAGDRTSKVEGGSSTGKEAVFSRVEQEANWQARFLLLPAHTQTVPAAEGPCQECSARDLDFKRVSPKPRLSTPRARRCHTSTRACSRSWTCARLSSTLRSATARSSTAGMPCSGRQSMASMC